MAGGNVRKIMAYLGLVDDEYDEYDDLSDRNRPVSPRQAPTGAGRPESRDRDYDRDYDREPRRTRERDDDYYLRPEPPRMAPVTRIRPMNQSGEPVSGPGQRSPLPPTQRPTMVSKGMSEAARVSVVTPLRFGDAKEVGEHIRANKPVIINLQDADRDLQRRMIDFCSGIAFAANCTMERVADQVFLLSPTDVTVSPEERARLERRGFNRDD